MVNEAEIVPHTFEISGNIEQLQYDQRCQQHQNIINLRNKCNKLCDLHKNQKVYFIRYILLQMHCIHMLWNIRFTVKYTKFEDGTIYHLIAVLIVVYNTTMMLKTVTTQLATLQQKYHLLQSRFQTFSNLSVTGIGLKIEILSI